MVLQTLKDITVKWWDFFRRFFFGLFVFMFFLSYFIKGWKILPFGFCEVFFCQNFWESSLNFLKNNAASNSNQTKKKATFVWVIKAWTCNLKFGTTKVLFVRTFFQPNFLPERCLWLNFLVLMHSLIWPNTTHIEMFTTFRYSKLNTTTFFASLSFATN